LGGWGTPQALLLFLIGVAAYDGGDSFTFVRHVLPLLVSLRIAVPKYSTPRSLLNNFLRHIMQNFALHYTLLLHVSDARCPSAIRTVAIWFLARCQMQSKDAELFIQLLLNSLRRETDQTDPINKWPDGWSACIRLVALNTLCACVGRRDKIVAELLDFVDRFGGSYSNGTIARYAVYVLKYYYGVDARSRYIQRLFSISDRQTLHSREYEEALLDMHLAWMRDLHILNESTFMALTAKERLTQSPKESELILTTAKWVNLGLKEDRLRTQRGLPVLIETVDVDGLAAACLNHGPVVCHEATLPHLFDILSWRGMPEVTRAHLCRACRMLDTTADFEALNLKHAIFDCLGRGGGPDDLLDLLSKSKWFKAFLESGASKVLRTNLHRMPNPYEVQDLAQSAFTRLRSHAHRNAFRVRPEEHWKFIALLQTLRTRVLVDDYREMRKGSRATDSPEESGKQLTSADVGTEVFRQAFEPRSDQYNESDQYRMIAAKDDVVKLMERVEAKLGSSARRVLKIMYEGFLATDRGYTKTEIGNRLGRSRETPYRVLLQIREMFQSEFGENC
jgi:hypothetical protein